MDMTNHTYTLVCKIMADVLVNRAYMETIISNQAYIISLIQDIPLDQAEGLAREHLHIGTASAEKFAMQALSDLTGLGFQKPKKKPDEK